MLPVYGNKKSGMAGFYYINRRRRLFSCLDALALFRKAPGGSLADPAPLYRHPADLFQPSPLRLFLLPFLLLAGLFIVTAPFEFLEYTLESHLLFKIFKGPFDIAVYIDFQWTCHTITSFLNYNDNMQLYPRVFWHSSDIPIFCQLKKMRKTGYTPVKRRSTYVEPM